MAKYWGEVPNDQLADLLMSSPLAAVSLNKARKIAIRYKASVPVRTGTLKTKVHTNLVIGGVKHDRLVARVTASAPYAAAMEFGHNTKKGRRVPGGHYLKRAAGIGE